MELHPSPEHKNVNGSSTNDLPPPLTPVVPNDNILFFPKENFSERAGA